MKIVYGYSFLYVLATPAGLIFQWSQHFINKINAQGAYLSVIRWN